MGGECVKAADVLCPKKQQLFKNISPSAKKMVTKCEWPDRRYTASTQRKMQKFLTYSVAIDKSTDIAELAFFVQSVCEDFQLVEEIV